MNENKQEQIIQGFNYAKNILDSINISGIENCKKLSTVYNNIDVFLNMLLNNEISIVDNQIMDEKKNTIKQKSSSNSNVKS